MLRRPELCHVDGLRLRQGRCGRVASWPPAPCTPGRRLHRGHLPVPLPRGPWPRFQGCHAPASCLRGCCQHCPALLTSAARQKPKSMKKNWCTAAPWRLPSWYPALDAESWEDPGSWGFPRVSDWASAPPSPRLGQMGWASEGRGRSRAALPCAEFGACRFAEEGSGALDEPAARPHRRRKRVRMVDVVTLPSRDREDHALAKPVNAGDGRLGRGMGRSAQAAVDGEANCTEKPRKRRRLRGHQRI